MKKQLNIFDENADTNQPPMAYSLRPDSLDYFVGQEKVKSRIKSLNFSNLPHIIFHGPPGCGKTTLAQILAKESGLELYPFNAVLGGVNDLRKIISEAIELQKMYQKKSIIFIDEIHRFNKAQQDALLPFLEKGDFVLFGATTEYPQTSINKAVISRVQIWKFISLTEDQILNILQNAQKETEIPASEEIIRHIAKYSNGDARSALNQFELLSHRKDELSSMSFKEITKNILFEHRQYDKNSDRHYDVISAFIKSIRGRDVDAAVLWLAVMLDGGETPEFIARRLIVSASEDIGNADPRALQMAVDAHYSIKNIGMPEARIILAQATTYLAQCPKSNASYLAINKALEYVRSNPTIEVPKHLRNNEPAAKDYKYTHDFHNHYTEQDYLSSAEKNTRFFKSSDLGYEKMQSDNMKKMRR